MRYDIDQIKRDVAGKWLSILSHFGIEIREGHGPCHFCGGKDRARWVHDEKREGLFCNGCDPKFRDGWAVLMQATGCDFMGAVEKISPIVGSIEPLEPNKPINTDLMQKLYKTSMPMQKGDVAHKYLVNRGLSMMDKLPKLGYCPKCYESETKKEHPAIVATLVDKSGNPLNMYRIYLTRDGKKLNINSPKKMCPSNGRKLSGGAIRLYSFDGGTLGVAEGIETAIAVNTAHNIPVWATLGTSLMEKFELPEGVTRLEIFADNDENYAGQKAACTLANKIKISFGIPVNVYVPTKPGTDFLDELLEEIQ